jgi:hypothetical protein
MYSTSILSGHQRFDGPPDGAYDEHGRTRTGTEDIIVQAL